jgi:hypothetical protein
MVATASATPVTVRTARELVRRLEENHDLIEFARAVSAKGWHFGSCNEWTRRKFEDSLTIELAIADLTVTNCIFCAVEDKVKDLSEELLHDISDLCLSELDRREYRDVKRTSGIADETQAQSEGVRSG